ncbi:MAG: MlaD family protein [Pirellulales bacterium]
MSESLASDSQPNESPSESSFPEAQVHKTGGKWIGLLGRKPSRYWLLTLVSLLVALLLWLTGVPSSGPRISIRFQQGHGIEPGDPVRHRGIDVGVITQVQLDRELAHVQIVVQLEQQAQRLVRAGSRFWIERPEISMMGVHGLETVLSGQYVAVIPGPEDAKTINTFDGLESKPQWLEQEPGSLEFLLENYDREGLEVGSPIVYRGIPIGQIVSVGLSPDATTIEARGVVRPSYRQLVRVGSRFWNTSGFDASFGVGGLKLHTGTLATITSGGVSMATPDPPDSLAMAGTRFRLQQEPDDWKNWSPPIPIGVSLLTDGSILPQPVKATIHWQEKLLGVRRSKEKTGWLLPMTDGRLLGPQNLLSLPADAVEQKASLQFEGIAIPIKAPASNPPSDQAEELTLLEIADPNIRLPGPWPTQQLRRMEQAEDCLILTGSRDSILPLAANRLQRHDGDWRIDPSFALNADAHGACIVAVRDGSLVGILVVEKGLLRIAFPDAATEGLGTP